MRPCEIWLLKFDGRPRITIGHILHAPRSYVCHFIATNELKLEMPSWNVEIRTKSLIFRSVWPWNLTDDLEKNRAPLLYHFKFYASFRSHSWIQAGVTFWKCHNWAWFYRLETRNSVKNGQIIVPNDLEIWRMTLENNRAPLLCHEN